MTVVSTHPNTKMFVATELGWAPNSEPHWQADARYLPSHSGSYAILLSLAHPALLPPRFNGTLPAGIYCYLGSALGPGGIRARCSRHLAGPRGRHWHIDWLSTAAKRRMAMPFVGTPECTLVERLLVKSWSRIPVDGFGSSDCRQCRAHLLSIAPHIKPAEISDTLRKHT